MDCLPQWVVAFDSLFTGERMFMLYLLYGAFVQALPDPNEASGTLYVFVFRFAHAISMNINVVRKPVKHGRPTANG